MEGITQRDFFAGMALIALLNRHEGPLGGFAATSRQAFLIAEQMMKAREEVTATAREPIR